MHRAIAGSLAMVLGVSSPAVSQEGAVDKASFTAQSGKEVRIGLFASVTEPCNGNPVPQLRIAKPPIGGKLIIRLQAFEVPASSPICAGKKLPAQAVFYQSDAGFAGPDAVLLNVGVQGQPIRTRDISILVSE